MDFSRLIALILAIGKLAALVLPLPDLNSKTEVAAWLAKLGISDPLAAIILSLVPDEGPVIVGAVSLQSLAGMSNDDVGVAVRQAIESGQIKVPEGFSIAAIIAMVKSVIELLKQFGIL